MIILNNMYTGRYITEQGKLGHEAINLVKADDGNFYIWLNSMGVCQKDNCTVIMVRSINSHLYKVLAKAENCRLCKGANISRTRKKVNDKDDSTEKRYEKQTKLGVTYNKKDPMIGIFGEKDMFATFCTKEVYETQGDVYLTNDPSLANGKSIYYADFKISEAMRAYIPDHHAASDSLKDLIARDMWKPVEDQTNIPVPEFNFFKLIRKDRDELSFSNALSYFIQEAGVDAFLQDGLELPPDFVSAEYNLLREKHNIDLAFFGEDHVVIIENKIDAGITANGNMTIDGQINKAVELYLEKGNEELKHFADPYIGDASQLSKYYLYAVAYLRSKGLDMTEIPHRIRCFLLIPKYAENQFGNEGTSYHSHFRFSQQYEIITYRKILEFFEGHPIDNRYFDDFVSALHPLAKEFDNDIEEEVKYRFFKAIGKV